MPRPPRVELEGVLDHASYRDNRRDPIDEDDTDRQQWPDVLAVESFAGRTQARAETSDSTDVRARNADRAQSLPWQFNCRDCGPAIARPSATPSS